MLLGVISMVLWVISMLFWVISMLRMSDSWNYSSAHLTILIYIIVSSHQWHCRGAAYQVFQNSLQHCCPLLKMGWAPSVSFQVLARKVVLTLIGPLKSGLEWRHNVLSQQGSRAACQVLHKSNLFLQHGCGAARQVLNESNLCQQYGCRGDWQVPN